jgi:hypothetical protein
VVASGKLLYLGYHSDDGTLTNGDSSSKHNSSSSDTNTSPLRSTRSISDSDSTGKKTISTAIKLDITHSVNGDSSPKHKSSSSDTKTSTRHSSSTKTDRDHSTNSDSGSKHKDSSATKRSSHSHDGSKSSSSDLASTIRNKVDSIIKNSLRGVRD